VTYRDEQRLTDISEAIAAIASHRRRGDLSDGLVFDAVRIRLIEIGEAVKALPKEVTAGEPTIPWSQIARMRDHLAHRYFDTTHAVVQSTVDHDLPLLAEAVSRLRTRMIKIDKTTRD
jgi:uncharacterized protein with HEPN domain